MKAYKGFNADMTCSGFQYREGETYETDKAELCSSGFHACERPLDVLNYYEPTKSVYHEVEIEDVSNERKDDSKVCGKKITIGAKLSIGDLVKAHVEYTKQHCTMERTDPSTATAGNRGAATAGEYGAATAGYRGAATSRGKSAVGKNGVAVARGNDVRVKGGMGAVLVLAEENQYDCNIKDWRAFVVDGETVKPDTWYALVDGELKEVEA